MRAFDFGATICYTANMVKTIIKKQELLIPTKFGELLCIFESNQPDPGFTVTSPAAPGFVTYGRTLGEAKKMAKEGLEFHCECILLEYAGTARRSFSRAVR